MTYQRIPRLLALVAAATFLIAACTPAAPAPTTAPAAPAAKSGSTPAAAPTSGSIRFGIYADPAREVVAKAQADAYMKSHPGVTVTVEAVPFSDYYKKLGLAIASGDAWDVFMINGAYFQQLAPEGQLLDLTDRIKQGGLNLADYTLDPGASDYQGKTYALPYELNMTALFYNKDLFDAAGVKYPTWEWKWQDLLDAAQKLTKTEGGKAVQWGFFAEQNYPQIHDFLAQNGGGILSADMTKPRIADAESVEALQFMVDLVQKHKVSPLPADLPQGVNPFMTGKVGMSILYSFSVQPTLKAPFKWGIAPLPTGKTAAYGYWTQAIAMAKSGKNSALAWDFATYLLGKEAQEIMAKERGATPSLKSVAKSSVYTEAPPEGMDVFVAEYEKAASAVPLPAKFSELMSGPTSAMGVNLTPAWNGQAPVPEAASKTAKEMERILGEK